MNQQGPSIQKHRKLLNDIHKKENVTLIMVTHESYVANMADRIITMLDGKIREEKLNNIIK